ncbi:hypothetical protein C8F04DRAFT_1255202 [Mycena alexandri]|uniref:Uncharacterized protein n=1 Tax=Mycena alexandri TaxID=1745969 RepID=A0AAD6T3H4_9AGAR|nr:hypothetical protein C8F04DRAFT_1255202 [Mycena alexandri]
MRLLLPLALLYFGVSAAPVPDPNVVARSDPIPLRPKVDDYMRRKEARGDGRSFTDAPDRPSDAIPERVGRESGAERTAVIPVGSRGCRLFLCL